MALRTLVSRLPSVSLSSFFSRSFATRALPGASPLLRFRPLLVTADFSLRHARPAFGFRCFSTRPTTSSLNDPSPNWSNRPPKETILLDGCDFEHWLVVMEPPDPSITRDEIIDSYIKTLAEVVGSEDEARMSLYSVSTKHYFAFGCKVSEELSYKIKALPKVRWVLPDSYLDVKNKDYGGEPFIDGKAVPYDPKYHEEWVRNNARAQERSRRNDRPRNFDRSRNFERRRENMQNFQNRESPPMQNQQFQNSNAPNPTPSNAQNQQFQNSNAPNPTPSNAQNQQFTTSNAPNPPPNVQTPLPPREGPPSYLNQVPNPQSSYVPNVGPNYSGSSPGYRGGTPGHQGGGQAYQAGNPGTNGPGGYQGGGLGGHAYQTNNPGTNVPGGPNYQGGGQAYQAGNPGNFVPGGPGYSGGGPGYQGGNPTGFQRANPTGYQGGPSGYQGGGPSYQGGGPGGHQGGNPPYQGGFSNYQSPNSSYQGSGQNYPQGDGNYQGRDMPGRDQ